MEDKLNYLEEERKKLWAKVDDFEVRLDKKTSDYEAEAKVSAEKSSEYLRIAETSKKSIEEFLRETETKLAEVRNAYEAFKIMVTEINEYTESSKINVEVIKRKLEAADAQGRSIEENVSKFHKLFENYNAFVEKVKKLEELHIKGEENASKIDTLHKSLLGRKKEIDDLYFEIIGYTDKDEATGVETTVTGLKEKLQTSYDELALKLKNTSDELTAFKEKNVHDYEEFAHEKENDFVAALNHWESQYEAVRKKIEDLLPNALTAGLSAAYSKKKDDEIIENAKLTIRFNRAIWGMIAVSLIPFAFSVNAIYGGKDLEEVILRLPRLVLAILPLYIPALWVAYSANRKLNLSKRLIEEYTHKEVLSKTFEGLSTQINNIEDKSISSDLRIKLLYNILEVNSENPGKLISDYNKSDHPIMDALDKSLKFADSLEKVSKFPGLGGLATYLAKKNEHTLKVQAEKAKEALDAMASNAPNTTTARANKAAEGA